MSDSSSFETLCDLLDYAYQLKNFYRTPESAIKLSDEVKLKAFREYKAREEVLPLRGSLKIASFCFHYINS